MNTTLGFLIPIEPGGITEPVTYHDENTRRLFGSFHDVFAAERQPERAIFWVESQSDRAIVRHVRNLKRKRKGEDQVVGTTMNDSAAVRILIGNFAAGCKLTTVRWELYDSFTLERLMDVGRFDYVDLTRDIDVPMAAKLRGEGMYPAGDWDFDGLLLMHRCQACRGVFDRESIIYLPNKQCETCRRSAAGSQSVNVIKALMLGYMDRLRKIATHRYDVPSGEFAVQHFVDPIPNSVIYWLLANHYGAARPDAAKIFGIGGAEQNQQWLDTMYHRSLFYLMLSDGIEKLFRSYLEGRGGDWELILRTLRRVGESLRTPELALLSADTKPEGVADSVDEGCVLTYFPDLINAIILEHLQPHYPDGVLDHEDN